MQKRLFLKRGIALLLLIAMIVSMFPMSVMATSDIEETIAVEETYEVPQNKTEESESPTPTEELTGLEQIEDPAVSDSTDETEIENQSGTSLIDNFLEQIKDNINKDNLLVPGIGKIDTPISDDKFNLDDPIEIEKKPMPGEVDENILALVRYLYVNDNVSETDTIDSVTQYNPQNVISQTEDYAIVYADDDNIYFSVDLPFRNGWATTGILDYAFARGNDRGIVLTEGVSLDPVTHIATISKEALNRGEQDFADIQLQVMIGADLDRDVSVNIKVENTIGAAVYFPDTVESRPYRVIEIPVECDDPNEISAQSLSIYLNGSQTPISLRDYAYDPSERILAIREYAVNISDIRINVHERPMMLNAFSNQKPYYTVGSIRNGVVTAYLPDDTNPDAFTVSDTSSVITIKWGSNVYGAPSTYRFGEDTHSTTSLNPRMFKESEEWAKGRVGLMGLPVDLFGVDFTMYATQADASAKTNPHYWEKYVSNSNPQMLPQAYRKWGISYDSSADGTPGGNDTGYSYNSGIWGFCRHVKTDAYGGDGRVEQTRRFPEAYIQVVDKRRIGDTWHVVLSVESTEHMIDDGVKSVGQACGAVFEIAWKENPKPGTMEMKKISEKGSPNGYAFRIENTTDGTSWYGISGSDGTIYEATSTYTKKTPESKTFAGLKDGSYKFYEVLSSSTGDRNVKPTECIIDVYSPTDGYYQIVKKASDNSFTTTNQNEYYTTPVSLHGLAGGGKVTITIKNVPTTGTMTMEKKTEGNLSKSGFKFKIQKPNLTYIYGVSDSNGKIHVSNSSYSQQGGTVFEELTDGNYKFTEVGLPSGVSPKDLTIKVYDGSNNLKKTISYASGSNNDFIKDGNDYSTRNEYITGVSGGGRIEFVMTNKKLPGYIELKKETTDGSSKAGYRFKVYRYGDSVAEEKTVNGTSQSNGTIKDDATGQTQFTGFFDGKYRFVENIDPVGSSSSTYFPSEITIKVYNASGSLVNTITKSGNNIQKTIAPNGQVSAIVDNINITGLSGGGHVEVVTKNSNMARFLTIKKTAEDGNIIGIPFEIKKLNTSNNTWTALPNNPYYTDNNGNINIQAVIGEQYEVKEIVPADTICNSTNPQRITIANTGNTVTFDNKPKKVDFTIKKSIPGSPSLSLSGFAFHLIRYKDYEAYGEYKVINEQIMIPQGGSYDLVIDPSSKIRYVVPFVQGYQNPDDAIESTNEEYNEDGTLYKATLVNISGSPIYVTIAGSNYLPGDPTSGMYSATTDASGEAHFNQIPAGRYWLQEDPKIGFVDFEPREITISSTGSATYTAANTPIANFRIQKTLTEKSSGVKSGFRFLIYSQRTAQANNITNRDILHLGTYTCDGTTGSWSNIQTAFSLSNPVAQIYEVYYNGMKVNNWSSNGASLQLPFIPDKDSTLSVAYSDYTIDELMSNTPNATSKDVIYTKATDTYGRIDIEDLPRGSVYYIEEIPSPNYKVQSKKRVTMGMDGTTTFEFENDNTAKLSLLKELTPNTSGSVSGWKFLIHTKNYDHPFLETHEFTAESSGNRITIYPDLTGTYVPNLTYKVYVNDQEVTFTDNRTYVTTSTSWNAGDRIRIVFVNDSQYTALDGTSRTISSKTDVDYVLNNMVHTTNAQGKIVEDIKPGNYWVEEIPVTGYDLQEPQAVTIKPNETVPVVFTNNTNKKVTIKKVMQNGSTNNLGGWEFLIYPVSSQIPASQPVIGKSDIILPGDISTTYSYWDDVYGTFRSEFEYPPIKILEVYVNGQAAGWSDILGNETLVLQDPAYGGDTLTIVYSTVPQNYLNDAQIVTTNENGEISFQLEPGDYFFEELPKTGYVTPPKQRHTIARSTDYTFTFTNKKDANIRVTKTTNPTGGDVSNWTFYLQEDSDYQAYGSARRGTVSDTASSNTLTIITGYVSARKIEKVVRIDGTTEVEIPYRSTPVSGETSYNQASPNTSKVINNVTINNAESGKEYKIYYSNSPSFRMATTDANGYAFFEHVKPDVRYRISEVQKPGWSAVADQTVVPVAENGNQYTGAFSANAVTFINVKQVGVEIEKGFKDGSNGQLLGWKFFLVPESSVTGFQQPLMEVMSGIYDEEMQAQVGSNLEFHTEMMFPPSTDVIAVYVNGTEYECAMTQYGTVLVVYNCYIYEGDEITFVTMPTGITGQILETDGFGKTPTVSLEAGTYYVEEIPKPGYKQQDGITFTLSPGEGRTVSFTGENGNEQLELQIKKTLKAGTPDTWSSNGWTFNIYNVDPAQFPSAVPKYSGTTQNINGVDGILDIKGLTAGTYWVKEMQLSSDWKPQAVKQVTVTDQNVVGHPATVTFENERKFVPGKLEITKAFAAGSEGSLSGWDFLIAPKNNKTSTGNVYGMTSFRYNNNEVSQADNVYSFTKAGITSDTIVSVYKAYINGVETTSAVSGSNITVQGPLTVNDTVTIVYCKVNVTGSKILTTDATGKVTDETLTAGDYYVEEIPKPEYMIQPGQIVTLVNSQTTSVSFVNVKDRSGEITATKFDEHGRKMIGVKIRLEYSTDGTNWNPIQTNTGDPTKYPVGTSSTTGIVNGALATGTDGTVTFKGLNIDPAEHVSYRLIEVGSGNKSLMKSPIDVELPETRTFATVEAMNAFVAEYFTTGALDKEIIRDETAKTVTILHVFHNLYNTPNLTLPMTGGYGVVLYPIIGSFMMFALAYVFFKKKKCLIK